MRKNGALKKLPYVIMAAIGIIGVFCAMYFPIKASVSAKEIRTVVIDAGHGGADGGVSGVRTKVKESDINLKIAVLLKEYLEGYGYRVVMTRTADVMLKNPKVTGNRKRADMFKRGEIINAAKPDAVISIHANFFSSSSRRGSQVFFGSGESGREFAKIVQDKLNAEVNSKNGGRHYEALKAEKYLLDCSPYPTVIVECGFLSNPFDEANLNDPEFRAMFAKVLCDAISEFIKLN